MWRKLVSFFFLSSRKIKMILWEKRWSTVYFIFLSNQKSIWWLVTYFYFYLLVVFFISLIHKVTFLEEMLYAPPNMLYSVRTAGCKGYGSPRRQSDSLLCYNFNFCIWDRDNTYKGTLKRQNTSSMIILAMCVIVVCRRAKISTHRVKCSSITNRNRFCRKVKGKSFIISKPMVFYGWETVCSCIGPVLGHFEYLNCWQIEQDWMYLNTSLRMVGQ